MIEISHLTKVYDTRDGVHRALDDVSLTINDGDIYGIIGQSGAGKSTLVRCINLLEHPTSGEIIINGQNITDFKGKKLLELRASIGMIFQHFSLFQQRNVYSNVTFPLELHRGGREDRKAKADRLLHIVGLEGYEKRFPSELSGGQQQRVAIARALINDPKIMLCDEATSALDTRTTVAILNLLREINRDMGVTLVVITHSLAVARKICNRIAVLDHGEVVEQGTTAEVFANPKSDVTKELILHDSMAEVGDTPVSADGNAASNASATGSLAGDALLMPSGVMDGHDTATSGAESLTEGPIDGFTPLDIPDMIGRKGV